MAAKTKVADLLRSDDRVRGIGITRIGDRYAVKVNVSGSAGDPLRVPTEVDGALAFGGPHDAAEIGAI